MLFSTTLAALLLLLPATSSAGSSASSAAPTADQIVAKAIAARGGLERIQAIGTIRLTGKITFGSGDGRIDAGWAQIQKRPGLIRSETTLQGLTAVEAYDGSEAWDLNPYQGRRDAEKRSADEAKSSAQDADIDGPLIGWREKGHRVEYLGTEDVDGTPAHRLRVILKDGDIKEIFLDPDYFLAIRVTTTTKLRGAEEVTEEDFGSYQSVDGVWMPFSVESGARGEPARRA